MSSSSKSESFSLLWFLTGFMGVMAAGAAKIALMNRFPSSEDNS